MKLTVLVLASTLSLPISSADPPKMPDPDPQGSQFKLPCKLFRLVFPPDVVIASCIRGRRLPIVRKRVMV